MSARTLSLGAPLRIPSPPLWVATDTLRGWLAQSVELGVPAEEETFAELDPSGRHWLTGAHAAQHGSRRLAVAELDLALVNGQTRTGYLPLPYREFSAAVTDASDRDADTWLHGLGASAAPDWAGTASYGPVRDAFATLALANTLLAENRVELPVAGPLAEQARQAAHQPAAVFSVIAEREMRRATPIVIDPELLAGLPSFEDAEEAFRYGALAALPFAAVYLDTSGADGSGARIELHAAREHEVGFRLLGGVVWPERGGLSVMPVGYPTEDRDLSGRPDFYGRVLFGVKSDLFPLTPGQSTPITEARFGLSANVLSIPPLAALLLQEVANPGHERTLMETMMLGGELDGEVQLGGTGATGLIAGSENPDEVDAPALARVVTQLACELLGVLYFLEVDGVQLAPAALPRSERRRAERDQRPVARTAIIQPSLTPRAYDDEVGDQLSGRRPPAHRYFVRGHYRHHRLGSRTADARPDLVKPCPKPGCGSCRRVPVMGHWKGPDGAPVVVKTRILKPRAEPPPE